MQKYTVKRSRMQEVFEVLDKHMTERSRERFCGCGSFLHFFADREETKHKLYQANFCGMDRWCPMCGWRLAEKDAMRIAILMDYIEAEHHKAFVMVTLTVPNVLGADLSLEISRFNGAFKKLTKRDEVARVVHGYIRKLEVTYDGNQKITQKMYDEKRRKAYYDRNFLKVGDLNPTYNTYHPHFHCIFAVNKSYFKDRTYVKQERWLELWRDVMGDVSITQVDVRRVRRGDGADGRDKAVSEVAKYAAKDSDYTHSQAVFDVFYGALKGRQVLTYSGLFAQANKKYKAKELEHYKTRDVTEYVWLLLYRWCGSEYIEKHRRELSQEEYGQLKKDSEDEMALQ